MEAKVGDRISLDAKKVGQARRCGVVEAVTQGLTGARLQIRWDDGHASVIAPRAGILLIERGNGKRPRSKPKAKSKGKKSR